MAPDMSEPLWAMSMATTSSINLILVGFLRSSGTIFEIARNIAKTQNATFFQPGRKHVLVETLNRSPLLGKPSSHPNPG